MTDQKSSDRVGGLDGLRDELSVLLRSIEDLDAEHAAGDMESDDYRELKDDYTVRAADLSRRIDRLADRTGAVAPVQKNGRDAAVDDTAVEETASDDSVEQSGGSADTDVHGNGRSRWLRPLVTALTAGAFAVVAGLLLARFSGERGVNDELTGNIEASTRQRSFECQELAGGGSDIVGALECYDEVLTQDPDNLEALTYRGWLLVLTAASAEQAGNEEQAQELRDGGLIYLDRAVAQDPMFLDARAFRAATYDRQGRGVEACAEVEALLSQDPPEFFVSQTAGIIERNGCS